MKLNHLAIATVIAGSVWAQAPAGARQLVLKEEWKAPADVEHPAAQDSLASSSLNLKLYGGGVGGIKPAMASAS